MKTRLARCIAIGLTSLLAWRAEAQTQVPPAADAKPPPASEIISSVTPLIAPRGAAVSLVGTLPGSAEFWIPQEPPGQVTAQAYQCEENATGTRTRLVSSAGEPSNGKTTFSVLIPASLPLGNYTLCAKYTGAKGERWYTVPVFGDSGRLQVVEETGAARVEVLSVPRVVYQEGGRYKFSVLGKGFSRIGADNKVLLNDQPIRVCWDKDPTCNRKEPVAEGHVVDTHQINLDLPASFKDLYIGSKKVRIRVGSDNESELDKAPSITLAHVGRDTPRHAAIGVLVLLILLVVVILGTNKSEHTVEGDRLSLLATLLLDKATDTYSLSRAQFYAWTGAAVFGYTYLTVAWTFLQGRLEFAPVPENLPGIILASAGTAAIVEGVSGGKPKGAGQMKPALADFISTGGMVVPDRLQFLVWTVVGVLTFLLLIVSSDPATIATLPPIPTDFLVLMGISSAGYLGGRMARKGGPVIDDVLATLGSLRLEIHGRFLSKNASFQIDGVDVTLQEIGGGDNADHLPNVIARDESAQDPNIGKVIALTIRTPKPEWLTRKTNPSEDKRSHTLTIINPDGQKSEKKFSITGPTAQLSASAQGKQPENDTLTVTPNDQVTLDASASKVDEGVPTFKWIVDDVVDPTAKGPKLVRTMAVGSHQVSVEITDMKQRTDIETFTIVVA